MQKGSGLSGSFLCYLCRKRNVGTKMKHRNINMKHGTCETKVGKEKQQCSENLQQGCTKIGKQEKNKS